MTRALNFIDLFAGAGGLSEGFIRAGYTPLATIEMDRHACNTLRTRAAFHWLKSNNQLQNYKKYLYEKQEKEDGRKLWETVPKEVMEPIIQEEIGKETISGIFEKVDRLTDGKRVDMIIGGPPCQTYSVIGRARMKEKVLDDRRAELYKYYVKFLERYKPEIFVFENVPGILTALKGEVLEDLKRLVKKAGYEMDLKKQDASDYGVLQKRGRVIIIGWKDGNGLTAGSHHYPDLEKETTRYKVFDDLFSDLPERKAGEGKLCAPVKYVKPLSEMKYLKESKIRGGGGWISIQFYNSTSRETSQ